jgi:hypothetical protein
VRWYDYYLSTLCSDNAFWLRAGTQKVIQFLPVEGIPLNMSLLQSTLRVEHLGDYLL